MSVISQLQNLAGFARIAPNRNESPGLPQFSAVDISNRSDFLDARSRLLRIHRALETLADLANVSTRFKLDLPDARSTQSLGLDLTNTAAALVSTEEINASPRSFEPFGPDWTNGSTALLTIGGVYDGTNGSGAISFDVTRAGIKGSNNLQIRVDDPLGGRIGLYNIKSNDPPDQQYSLDNGLFFTLGAGELFDPDTTSMQVFDAVGAAVDPDKPLGGVRNDNPNLEFGTPDIVDGAFDVNGETISVATVDSLNDVVNRINLSDAGVTAVFNAGMERIEFVQDTTGSVPTIEIQDDTSNFIESTKLDTAIVTPGIDPESAMALDAVAAFSSVQTGAFLINGTPIAVDSASDSLTSILDKINASAADVTASFDAQTQLVTIAANESASELDIDSNGTELFAALKIPEGRVNPEVRSGGISRQRSYSIADALETVTSELNALFQDKTFDFSAQEASLFRSPLDSALRNAFGDADAAFGISFDRSADALRRGDFASVDRPAFTRSLQLRGADVKKFFAGSDGDSGLIASLYTATVQALTSVSSRLGQAGVFVDTVA